MPQDHEYASHVTWFAAQAYAQWVIDGGHLPTEAQWEKAGGPKGAHRYPSEEAWEDEPVSSFGVRLCHLLEWTQDAFDKNAYDKRKPIFDPIKVPSASDDEATRTVRGRDPNTSPASYSLTKRVPMEPVTGAFTAPVGFRVVVDLEQEGAA